MRQRPAAWNGVPVPYGASAAELGRAVRRSGPERWAAFVALAHTPGDPALTLLREGAESSDPHVRRIAVEAIGVHADGHQLHAIVCRLMADPHDAVVRSACEAAGDLRLAEAHDSVLRLMSAANASTRGTAVRTMRNLWQKDDFDPVFEIYRTDEDADVRKEAAWTLQSVATTSTWRALFDAWHDDPMPRHRAWACDLAAAHGGPEMVMRLSLLANDHDGHVRRRAEQALQTLGKHREVN